MNLSDKALQAMLAMTSKKFGTSPENLKKDLQSGNINGLMKKMDTDDAKKLQNALNNPDLAKKIYESPEAQDLMRKISGNK